MTAARITGTFDLVPELLSPPADIEITGTGGWGSIFPVSDLAVGSIAAAGAAAAAVIEVVTGRRPEVVVDRRLASWWFARSIEPVGWEIPPAWDAIAGDYEAADGWIKLHTNAPHHRAAALDVLGPASDRAELARAVERWEKDELETAIVEAGGAAAAMRSPSDWRVHPQGRAVAVAGLVETTWTSSSAARATGFTGRPLAGVRVLDLTRVLAGPVATRFLAGLGAEVLRLDPPGWSEPGVEPDVTLGKRLARIDLRDAADRSHLERLLAGADVLVHGYRSDALDRLGLGADRRRELAPGLVDVALDAYGWTGPWATRRGFDSLVQMSSGIAWAGGRHAGVECPVPLPVQALDHATGYLMAAAVLTGWRERLMSGRGSVHRTSLARTAYELLDGPPGDPDQRLDPLGDDDFDPSAEATGWGPARRLRAPLTIGGEPLRWARPAGPLGRDPRPAEWPDR